MAVFRSRKSGIQRPADLIRSARSNAAGDIKAIHNPPSDPKDFWGAK